MQPRGTLVAIGLVALSAGAMLGAAGVGVAHAGNMRPPSRPLSDASDSPAALSALAPAPTAQPAPTPPADLAVTQQRVGRRRSPAAALTALGLPAEAAARAILALQGIADLSAPRAGDVVQVERDPAADNAVRRVLYRRSDSAVWAVECDPHGEFVPSTAPEPANNALPAPAAAPPAPRPRTATAAAGARVAPQPAVAPGPVTGYVAGEQVTLTVTLVDGKPVERATARAFERLRAAALRAGVHVQIVSGFRTMEHQRGLYAAFRAGHGHLAAQPGFSHHQSGHALDLNTSAPGVRPWLDAHAMEYGFRRTVPTEAWHWEHW